VAYLKVLSGHSSGMSEENHEIFVENNWLPRHGALSGYGLGKRWP